MSNRTSGEFDIDDWKQEAYHDEDGVSLARATVTKTYRGAIAGTSVTDLLLNGGRVEGSMAYTGQELLRVTLDGRAGTFVLQHQAVSVRGAATPARASILADTGTGELDGISGSAEITQDAEGHHTLTLDYEL
jgi:hypothetical protein